MDPEGGSGTGNIEKSARGRGIRGQVRTHFEHVGSPFRATLLLCVSIVAFQLQNAPA